MQSSIRYTEDTIGFKLALRLKKVYELATPVKTAYTCEEEIEDEFEAVSRVAHDAREAERKIRDAERQEADRARKERRRRRNMELAERATTGRWKGKDGEEDPPSEQHASSRRPSAGGMVRTQSSGVSEMSEEEMHSENSSMAGSRSHPVFTFTGNMNGTNGMPIRLTAEEKEQAEREYEAELAGVPIPPQQQYPAMYGPPAAIVIREDVVLPRPPSTTQGVYYQQQRRDSTRVQEGSDDADHANQVQDPSQADPPIMFRTIAVSCVALIVSSFVSIMALAAALSQRWLVAEGTTANAYPLLAEGIVTSCSGASCSKKDYDQVSSCGASGSAIKMRYEGVMTMLCLGLVLSVTLTVLLAVIAFRVSHFRVIFARLAADPRFFANRREALDHRVKVKRKQPKVIGEIVGTKRAAAMADERAKLEKTRVVVVDLQKLRGSIRSTIHVIFVSVVVGLIGWILLIAAPALYQHTEERFIHCGTSSCDVITKAGTYTCGFGSGYALAVCAALFGSFTLVIVVVQFVLGLSDVYTSLVTVGALLEFEEGVLQTMYVEANVRVAAIDDDAVPDAFTPTNDSSPVPGPASSSDANPLAQRHNDMDLPVPRSQGKWVPLPLYARSIDTCPQSVTHPNFAQSSSDLEGMSHKKASSSLRSSTRSTWAAVGPTSNVSASTREANGEEAWYYCERQRLYYNASVDEYYDPGLRRWFVPNQNTWFQAA